MKLVTYVSDYGLRAGTVVGEFVVDVAETVRLAGVDDVPPESVLDLLEAGESVLRRVAEITEPWAAGGDGPSTRRGAVVGTLGSVHLAPPIPNPRQLLCLAGNYEEHIREGGRGVEEKDQCTPRVFMKPPSTTLIGPGETVRLSRHARFIDYEGELCVVIGRRAKYVAPESALEYVAGYTVFNDISERRLQIRPREASEEWDRFFDWLNGKWLDTHGPCGPWMVTRDEVPDPQNLELRTWVNGELRQQANTCQMIFAVADVVSYISHLLTLEPGDLIATGTPAGVGLSRDCPLGDGDEIIVEIEGVGRLINTVSGETD